MAGRLHPPFFSSARSIGLVKNTNGKQKRVAEPLHFVSRQRRDVEGWLGLFKFQRHKTSATPQMNGPE